jgi:hypothetical protein
MERRPFETSQVEVSGNTVFVRSYGKGPAILILSHPGADEISQNFSPPCSSLNFAHTSRSDY